MTLARCFSVALIRCHSSLTSCGSSERPPVSPYAKSASGTAKPDFVTALPAELRCG